MPLKLINSNKLVKITIILIKFGIHSIISHDAMMTKTERST